ncbi:hypothetical protein DFH27DRAFT_616671 [Peziza echinospora]|nr:hypothetical protein DFH27DRAFT_616671 [Peziza echinospora]
MAVWSHVVHNSTNIQVDVLGAGAINLGRQEVACISTLTMCGTTPPMLKLKSWELVQSIWAVK